METIDETEEATTSSEELNQLIQQLQQELIGEDKRHFDTLAYYNSRIQEERDSIPRSSAFWKQDYSKLLLQLKAV